MIRRPPRSTLSSSSAASDVYKRQAVAVDQEPAQPTTSDEGGQRGGGHDLHGGGANSGGDQRYGERYLDPAQQLTTGHAHSAGGLLDLRVDAAHAYVGVGQGGRYGEQCQRDHRRPVAETDRGNGQQHQDCDHRDRPASVGDVDRQRATAADMAQPEGHRQGDRRGDEHGGGRELDVLEHPVPYAVGAAPVAGVD